MFSENVNAGRENNALLGKSIPRLFLKFALPGVAGLLFLGIQSVIDGIMLGRFVGPNALASANLILPCYSLMAALAVILGVGCQTLIGLNLGRSDKQTANDSLTSLFIALLGFSTLISTTLWAFAPQIARVLGANDVLIADSVAYIRSLAPFFPLLSVMFLSDYVIKMQGHPVRASVVMGSTVVINIVLDYLFIARFGWGTTGAGLATGLAFTAGAILNVPFLFDRRKEVCVQRGRFRPKLVWDAFYNGSSEGVSELSAGITVFMFNAAMMHYLGEDGVAAFTVINYILFVAITVFLGISDGIIPIISYNHGAGRTDRVAGVLKLAARTNLTIGVVLFLFLFTAGEKIIGLFFTTDAPKVLEIAARGVRIYCFAFMLNGLNILSSSYFTAIGNAKISVVISMLRGLIFPLSGILILPPLFGIESIWFDIPLAELATFAVSLLLVRRSLAQSLPARSYS